jgi:tRNA A37 methylthiotransferase MiaB
MKRGYKVKDFIQIVDKFRAALPEITLSTDIIIGYPGETEEQFQNSVELVKKVRPHIINITRFSARPGTEAYNHKDKIHGRIQKERSRILTKVRFEISKMINEKHIGNEVRILVTEVGKNDSIMGRTDSYLPVVVKEKLQLGTFQEVEIVEATDAYLIGKIIE